MNNVCPGCEPGQTLVQLTLESSGASARRIAGIAVTAVASIDTRAEDARGELAAAGITDTPDYIGRVAEAAKHRIQLITTAQPALEVTCPGKNPDGSCGAQVLLVSSDAATSGQ